MDNLDKWYASETETGSGYLETYQQGLLGLVWNKIHKQMEKPFKKQHFSTVLELGAGHGQHFKNTKHTFDRYFETDIRIDNLKKFSEPHLAKEVKSVDATNLVDFDDHSVDRLIATCLLAHLDNPYGVLQEWRRIVKPGGVITIYIPTEGGS